MYKLVDDYDYTVSGIIITDKPLEEVQDIVDEARNADDGYWDTMMYAFEQNGIQYISMPNIERVLY